MVPGLPVVLLSLAQAAPAASASPAPPSAATQPAPRPDGCHNEPPSPNSPTVVVCAPRPEGYRIDPDVLEARRQHRDNQAGGPAPRGTMEHNDCATVGPMGCRFGPSIDLVAAAAVLAKMAATASQGGDVGKMFETTPEMSEYQLYVEAKKRREAKQAADAAAKAKAAARAKAQAPTVAPLTPATTAPQPAPHD